MAKLHSENFDFANVSIRDKIRSVGGAKIKKASKQNIVEHKLFGSKRKNIRIGKMFRKKGKDVGNKKPVSAKQEGNKKGSGVSPSMAEFDKMMGEISKKSSGKSMFKKKD